MSIKVNSISKSFSDKVILDNVNFVINDGKIISIIGRSGCGKSVLVKILANLLRPDKGSIIIDDISLYDDKHSSNKFFHRIGYLFQNCALFDSLTIWENIGFSLIYGENIMNKEIEDIYNNCQKHRNKLNIIKDFIASKLELVNLNSDIIDLFPTELSGGMQKRVAMLRALINDPDILFLDEPSSGLDNYTSSIIDNLIIKNSSSNKKRITIVISHDIKSVKKISDEIMIIRNSGVNLIANSENICYNDIINYLN